jgi:hypothetical protein
LTVRIGLVAATASDATGGSSMVLWLPAMLATCSDPESEKNRRRFQLEEIPDMGVLER